MMSSGHRCLPVLPFCIKYMDMDTYYRHGGSMNECLLCWKDLIFLFLGRMSYASFELRVCSFTDVLEICVEGGVCAVSDGEQYTE